MDNTFFSLLGLLLRRRRRRGLGGVKFIGEEKAEKNGWSVLSSDIGNMENRFEQSGFNTALQIEQNKKRKSDLAKLKSDLAESNIAHEGILAAPRQKENSRISEFGEQIEAMVDRANM